MINRQNKVQLADVTNNFHNEMSLYFVWIVEIADKKKNKNTLTTKQISQTRSKNELKLN